MKPIDPEIPSEPRATAQPEDRKKTFARRALIQAGWALPAAAMISMPERAGAASNHTDSAGVFGPPGGHADLVAHNDNVPGHSDQLPHTDFIPGSPHFDTPVGHFDNGAPHLDGP